MHIPTLRPLALALGLALGLGSGSASAAAFQASDVDPSVSACTDFNAYANGKWLAANPVPSDRSAWGTFEVLDEESLAAQKAIVEAAVKAGAKAGNPLEHKIGILYGAGMDTAAIDKAGLKPVEGKLAAIDAISDRDALTAFIRDGFARGEGIPFGFYGNADFHDSKTVIAYVMQGGTGLPERDYYLGDSEDYKAKREAYRAHIAKILELAGDKPEQAKARADQVLALETRLAKASLGRVELRDPATRYNFVTFEEADKVTPNFPWKAFFEAQGAKIDKGFSLAQPAFFKELDAMLAGLPLAEWQAYLRFHTLDNAAPYLSSPFVDADFEFYGKTLRGQQERKPRWKEVLDVTNRQIGMALGELYVARHFSPDAKHQAQELVDNLAAALKTRIENLDWMGEETKKKALAKWQAFVPKIGYPDKWRDWSGLELTPGEWYANVERARKYNYDYMVAKIGKPVDRSEWFMTPQTVNAYYSPAMNEIVFPAAILQPPFFDPKADPALNYGGIGAVIGHEMSHGYDDSGSRFDASGNFTNWWTDEDRQAFESRTDKLVSQFDAYEAIDGLHVKGQLTLGENIADLGGLATAWDALQIALKDQPELAGGKIDGFTQAQRFFLNWATVWRRNFLDDELKLRLNTDPHAPAGFRAIGAPSNMAQFANAFGCKAGDPMVRSEQDQVHIW